MVDWQTIKTEYVTTDTSYRKLADKYNVSMTEVSRHGKKECWREERQKYLDKYYTKTLDTLVRNQQKRVERIQSLADKILDKIEKSVDEMDELDSQTFRQLTAAIKDIKEIQMLKSDADMREQEARIDKLNRDVKENNKDDKKYGVVLLPTVMPLTPPENDE